MGQVWQATRRYDEGFFDCRCYDEGFFDCRC